jgi:hypothetical protein
MVLRYCPFRQDFFQNIGERLERADPAHHLNPWILCICLASRFAAQKTFRSEHAASLEPKYAQPENWTPSLIWLLECVTYNHDTTFTAQVVFVPYAGQRGRSRQSAWHKSHRNQAPPSL